MMRVYYVQFYYSKYSLIFYIFMDIILKIQESFIFKISNNNYGKKVVILSR